MRTTSTLTALVLIGILMSVAASNPAFAASISLKCKDGKTVSVSTGTPGGSCSIEADDIDDCMSAPGVCQYAGCTDNKSEGWGGCDGSGKAWCGQGCTVKLVGTSKPPPRVIRVQPPPGLLENSPGSTPNRPSPSGTPTAPRQPTGPVLR
jgi:hypothetical protein